MTSEELDKWIPCDKCHSAQSMYLVKMINGELYFCGHHLNEYKEALDKVAYEIVELNKKEEVPQTIEERI